MMGILRAGALALAIAAGPGMAQQVADAVAPEGSAARGAQAQSDAGRAAMAAKAAGQATTAARWMISAAHPLAAEAGAQVLDVGGSAADAMVAAQAVLGLVEPQSSGLGGGAFLVWYNAADGSLSTLDGRETAPLAATPTLFQDQDGAPLKFFDAVVGGRSVGTPGTPALMEAAHRRWGRSAWGGLFDAATALAEDGFAVSPRLAGLVARDAARLARYPDTAAYFLPGGVPLVAGETLRNPAYAASLRALAAQGARAIYGGVIGAEIIRKVQGTGDNPGVLSMRDLAIYEVRERAPVCGAYRALRVCGMGPPSSGGLTLAQILGMLSHFDLPGMGAEDPQAWRLIGDASRLAFADRGRFMADSDYVPMPVQGLIAPDYLANRALLLGRETALDTISPGNPAPDHAANWADDMALELPSTSHISIVDVYGNVLSMTTTIENAFGARLMAGGFLLNNELTDFSFRTHRDGVPIANALAPGKRPRSSMAPTIVMRGGKPVLAIGSPGGSRIIGYVAKSIIAWADWGLDVQQAIALPHLVNRFGTFDLEAGTPAEALAPSLAALGYEVAVRGLNSGLHAIEIGATLQGGADPRREGIALGQ